MNSTLDRPTPEHYTKEALSVLLKDYSIESRVVVRYFAFYVGDCIFSIIASMSDMVSIVGALKEGILNSMLCTTNFLTLSNTSFLNFRQKNSFSAKNQNFCEKELAL